MILNVQVYRGGQLAGQQAFDSDVHRTIKIGRLSSAQIKLEDPKVSRIHAVIEFNGNEVSLIDMGSTEGTLVNGQKVHKVKLNSGDQVGIGDTVLVVVTGAAAAAQVAAPAAAPAQAAMPAMGAPAAWGAPAAAPPAGAPPAMGRPPAMAGQPPRMPGAAPGAMPGAMPPAMGLAGQMPPARPGMAPTMGAPMGAAMAAPMGAPAAAPGMPPPMAQPRFDAPDQAAVRRITGQRLRAAAVESKPHPALAPEQQMTADNRLLELRFYWGEVLLGMMHYEKPKKITIGETRKTNIFISSEGLPTEEFPLIRYADDEYLLTFTNHMEGEVELKGQLENLQALRSSSVCKRDEALSESYNLKMPQDARAIVHWGGATFALRFVPPSERIKSEPFKNVDLQYLNFLVMSLFFHVAWIVTLMVYPYDTESLREDLFDKPDRFASLILEPPKTNEDNKNLLEKIQKKVEEKKEEIVKKEEKKQPEKQLKITTKTPPQVKPQKTEQQKKQEVAQKFSKLFAGAGGGGAGSLLGGGGGGSLAGTLSNVIGTAGAGSASAGMAGLGIRGTGPLTGGGVGTSRGIAGIGTSGRLGGGGMAYGSNVGLGKGKERGVIDIGTPVVMGALPMEVIKKVIDENKAQIRYCYELELQRNQSLEGRVAMKWVIAATGSVATVKVKESTINNPNVENCIANKIKTWRFPPPAGGGIVEVNYPFIFKSS